MVSRSGGQVPSALVRLTVVTGLAYIALRYLVPIFLPFLLGLTGAILIDPWVDRVERLLGGRRGAAVLAVLGTVSLAAAGLTALGVGRIYAEVQQFARSLPDLDRGVGAIVEEWLARAQRLYSNLPAPVVEAVQANRFRLYQELQSLVGRLTDVVVSLPRFVVVAVVAWLATFFISRDKTRLAAWLGGVLPQGVAVRFGAVQSQVAQGIVRLVRAQLMLAGMTTIASVASLAAFGVPYAWLLGLLAGVLDIVPLAGPWLVFVPVVGWLAVSGRLGRAAGLAAVCVAAQGVRQAIEPRVVGASLGVHPLLALAAAYVGVKVMGPVGILAGPYVLVVLKAVIGGGLVLNETGGNPRVDRIHREAGYRGRRVAAREALRRGPRGGRERRASGGPGQALEASIRGARS